jgi:hypothetical protein
VTPENGWARLADALDQRRQDLGMTQAQVYAAGGPSKAWQAALRSREAGTPSVREQTMLPRLDRAVRWPDGTARGIVTGRAAPNPDPTGTPALTEFVLARYAEDEAWAEGVMSRRFAPIPNETERPDTPARIIADVEAKRRIVERCEHYDGDELVASDVLRHLATVYADHPDYRDEWRP